MDPETKSIPPKKTRLARYRVSLVPSVSAPPGNETVEPPSPPSAQMVEVGDDFCTSMELLWQFTMSVGSASQQTQTTNVASLTLLLMEMKEEAAKGGVPLAGLNVELALNAEEPNGQQETVSTVIPVCTPQHFTRCREFSKRQRAAFRILHQASLQQMVNAFERLLAETLYGYLLAEPDSLPKDKTLTYREILGFGTLDAAKSHVVYDEVDNFLRRKSTREQIAYFKDALKVDLRQDCPDVFDRVADVVLRRHAIVHAAKFAEAEYWRLRAKLPGLPALDRDKIDVQNPTAGEIRESWDIVYAAGVILCDKVARSLARRSEDPAQIAEVDSFLIQASFACIKSGRFGAAERILHYARTFRLQKDTSNLFIAVNLAQSLRWQGKIKESNDILASHDWDACHAGFQLCVAAIQDDEKAFSSLLPDAAHGKKVTLSDMYEWPVFRQMRKRADFDKWICDSFGISVKDKPKASPFHVLRFDSRYSFDEVGDLLCRVVAPPPTKPESVTPGASTNGTLPVTPAGQPTTKS